MTVKSSHVYKQLEEAERKGDLKKQFDILKNMLVTHQHLGIAELKNSLSKASILAIKSMPPATTCLIDQKAYALQFLQNDKIINTVSLPRPENFQDYDSIEWIQAGQVASTVFNIKQLNAAETPTLEVLINSTYSGDSKYGIKLSGDYPVLNIRELDKLLANAYLENFLWGFVTQSKNNSYPLEMSASFKSDKIAVADRGAGIVYLVDAASQAMTHSFKIREAGHPKRINLTFSTDSQYLFVTDNQTNQVFRFDTGAGEQQVFQVEVPVCSNLLYSRKKESIYLAGINPPARTIEILECSPDDFSIINRTALNGEPFSLGYDPGDLMAASPSGKHLIVMTSTDQPMMYTPHLSLIDLEDFKVINTMSLKIDQKPMNIALRGAQKFPPNSSLKDVVLGEGLIDKKTFSEALGISEDEIVIINQVYKDDEISSHTADGSAPPADQGTEESGEGGFAPAGGGNGSGGQVQQRKADPEFQKLNSVKVEKYIYEYCVEQFAKKTKIELNEEDHATSCDRLRTACTKARNDLVYQSETKVQITFFVNDHDLDVEVSRDQVMGALQAEDVKPKQSFQAVCQECGKPLPPNGGDCLTCHPPERKETEEEKLKFNIAAGEKSNLDQLLKDRGKGDPGLTDAEKLKQLEDKMLAEKKVGPLSREDMMAKMKQSNFGMTKTNGEPAAAANTPDDGYTMLYTDHTRNQVVEVDRNKQVKWKFGGFGSPAEEKQLQKGHAEKTGNNSVLIVDTINKKVVEVSTADNSIINNWTAHLSSPQSAVKLENGNILVTDKAKIMELDTSDNIVWSYENNLNKPSFAIKTKENTIIIADRVNNFITEISPESEPVWFFDGVNKPEYVQKLENGNFLVADSGNNRVVEISPEKTIVWEFSGKPKGGMRIIFTQPTQAFRLKSGTTMIIHSNERKAIEVDHENNIVWQNSGASLT
jgi:hypothetical protein